MDEIVTKTDRVEDLLVELSLCEDEYKELNVVLLSDNEEFKKLNYFIFSSVEGINYITMESPYDQDLTILSEMDMVIFHKRDKKLEELILENILRKNLNTKFIHVVDNKSYRKVDFLNEYLLGVSKIIKIDDELEEYVFEVQKELRKNFYSVRLEKLSEKKYLTKRDEFEERINELIENRVFFTKLRYKFNSDMDIYKYNIQKIIRKRDTIYVDKDSNEIYFLLLDVMPKKASQIIKDRIKNFTIMVNEVSQKNVFDLLFE